MITNEDIESGNYSMNDVADLKMRLDILSDALKSVIWEIRVGNEMGAYEMAVNESIRATEDHQPDCSGEVILCGDGDKYRCECSLLNDPY